MNETPIRAYSKQELAQTYFPVVRWDALPCEPVR